ncbi:MAG TPA: SAM-dependent methyltransferase [Lachnospiraceae bacterium]|nr:SAM-dependent methyltransferase [Lachnospiraceae bacterium]
MTLSKRMETVALMVTKGNKIADIGTDHGYVPISLVERGIAKSAIAMDVRKGPLSKATQNIKERNLGEKIETRLSNGLEKLREGEVDTVIIAGMGGDLVAKILQEGAFILPSIEELVVQPQSEIYKVRQRLHDLNWKIVEEKMLIEEGKYYTVIKAIGGKEQYEKEWEYLYGKQLLEGQDPILEQWLLKEKKTSEELLERLEHVDSPAGLERKKELLHKVENLKGGLAYYEGKGTDTTT